MKLTGKTVSVIVGAVVVAAAIVAVATNGSSSSPSGTAVVTNSEYQPVRITGDALPVMPEAGTDPGIGAKVPAVEGYDFSGDAVSLDVAASGKPTMVVFLAHWCPHCNREIPRILEWAATVGVPEGLRIVGVATGSRNDYPNWPPSAWLVDMGWKWEKLADTRDGQVFSAYGGTSFPTMVLVAPDGTVMDRFSGEAEVSELEARITAFMQKVSPV